MHVSRAFSSANDMAGEAAPRPAPAGCPAPGVLIVEQDPLTAEVLRTKLLAWGYEVRVARAALEALHAFRHDPARIVFVGTGVEGAAELCSSLRRLPTRGHTYIVCVGRDDERLGAALEAGADEVIRKPINVQRLRLRLRNARRLLRLDDALSGRGIDPATDCITRPAFERFLAATLAQARRTGSHSGLLFVRLADHRGILAGHGFEAAHAAVVALGERLEGLHRGGDLVGRVGEAEFCVLLQNADADGCEVVAARVLAHTDDLRIPVAPREDLRVEVTVEAVEVPPQEEAPVADLLDDLTRRRPCGRAGTADIVAGIPLPYARATGPSGRMVRP